VPQRNEETPDLVALPLLVALCARVAAVRVLVEVGERPPRSEIGADHRSRAGAYDDVEAIGVDAPVVERLQRPGVIPHPHEAATTEHEPQSHE
jgi:hypothetical protein